MTSFMIRYKPGDVILIPFPFTDFSTFKQRPAVIISSEYFNRTRSDVIIMAITSNLREKTTLDYELNKEEQIAAGLPQASVIKLGKIVTLDQRLIRKHIGSVLKPTLKHIFKNLRKIIS